MTNGNDVERFHTSLPGHSGYSTPASAGHVFGDWPLVSSLEFYPLTSAVPCARLHTRVILTEWGLGHLSETAQLVVSELMTNSLNAIWAYRVIAPVVLRVMASRDFVRLEVWDAVPKPPVQRPHDIDAESGRGLELVAALCDHWDTCFPGPGGKMVYAVIRVR